MLQEEKSHLSRLNNKSSTLRKRIAHQNMPKPLRVKLKAPLLNKRKHKPYLNKHQSTSIPRADASRKKQDLQSLPVLPTSRLDQWLTHHHLKRPRPSSDLEALSSHLEVSQRPQQLQLVPQVLALLSMQELQVQVQLPQLDLLVPAPSPLLPQTLLAPVFNRLHLSPAPSQMLVPRVLYLQHLQQVQLEALSLAMHHLPAPPLHHLYRLLEPLLLHPHHLLVQSLHPLPRQLQRMQVLVSRVLHLVPVLLEHLSLVVLVRVLTVLLPVQAQPAHL